MQSDNGKGMKGGHKRGKQKQKVRKVHFAALMDIRHVQKYEYIPENVRKSNLKGGKFLRSSWRGLWKNILNQYTIKELYTKFQRRSMKQEWGQKI